MQQYVRPELTLDQAYQAAFLWLDHLDQAPTSISEPADGLVELRSDAIVARVRFSRSPVTQHAVLAMLRQADTTSKRALFSVTGYTHGAVSIADTQGVALFSFDATGQAQAENAHALAMMPGNDAPVPFPPSSLVHDDLPVVTAPPEDMEYDLAEWLDCPRCGLTHHHNSNFCMSCGADLHTAEVPPTWDPKPEPEPAPAAEPEARLTLVSPDSGPTLRCRTCGSHDIELVQPNNP